GGVSPPTTPEAWGEEPPCPNGARIVHNSPPANKAKRRPRPDAEGRPARRPEPPGAPPPVALRLALVAARPARYNAAPGGPRLLPGLSVSGSPRRPANGRRQPGQPAKRCADGSPEI